MFLKNDSKNLFIFKKLLVSNFNNVVLSQRKGFVYQKNLLKIEVNKSLIRDANLNLIVRLIDKDLIDFISFWLKQKNKRLSICVVV